MNFSDLGLSQPFLDAVEELGYEKATPIQGEAIPVILSGKDLIGCAQTGTGKTAAFTLPTLHRLLESLPARAQHPAKKEHNKKKRGAKGRNPKPRAIRALILSPTRELAVQIEDSLKRYGKFTPLRQTTVYGGVSQFNQVKALRHGVDALVATPGRLLDLKEQGHIDLSKVEILIFDEADQMMDMGFLPALQEIVAAVPEKRQTLMFSATMPPAIRKLAQQWLQDPISVEVVPAATPAERIAQSVHLVDRKRKHDLLTKFLKESVWERTLVFSRTKRGADKLVKQLVKRGLHATAIHGDKTQGARKRALAQFKSKRPPVLVATDVAARGLDINNVSHVVNFDLPESPETYIHRIGRTARAGAEGVAVSFCAGDERGLLKQIERLTKVTIPVEPTVEGFEPTEPVTPASAGKSRFSRGRRGSGKFGRFKQSSSSKNKRRKGSTEPVTNKKKSKGEGESASKSKPRKRKRKRPAVKQKTA